MPTRVQLNQVQKKYAVPHKPVARPSVKASKYRKTAKTLSAVGDLIGIIRKKAEEKDKQPKGKPDYYDRLRDMHDKEFNSQDLGVRLKAGGYTKSWKDLSKEGLASKGYDVEDIPDEDFDKAREWGLKRGKPPDSKSVLVADINNHVKSGDWRDNLAINPDGSLQGGEGNYTGIAPYYAKNFGVDIHKHLSPSEVRQINRVALNARYKSHIDYLMDSGTGVPNIRRIENGIRNAVKKGDLTNKEASDLIAHARKGMVNAINRDNALENFRNREHSRAVVKHQNDKTDSPFAGLDRATNISDVNRRAGAIATAANAEFTKMNTQVSCLLYTSPSPRD